MANILKKFVSAPNKILYLFPHADYELSFSTWEANKKQATQESAPDLGRYSVTLDDTYRYWMIFEGSGTPSDWDQWTGIYDIYASMVIVDDIKTLAITKINQHRS